MIASQFYKKKIQNVQLVVVGKSKKLFLLSISFNHCEKSSDKNSTTKRCASWMRYFFVSDQS